MVNRKLPMGAIAMGVSFLNAGLCCPQAEQRGRELGCGEMAQRVEHLLHALEDPSLRPQHPLKKSGKATSTYNPCAQGWGWDREGGLLPDHRCSPN